eukprot:TRINITY_DN109455_c0_g1_i1.p1 TRINITY_DN109455_c0_g1~~TRINITY_DN109455_c0_g1_i1.p1  ORF type:complete len:413 (+),score=81.93 TRINITY_DN109455_c0_g1_i1:76-1314(+)
MALRRFCSHGARFSSASIRGAPVAAAASIRGFSSGMVSRREPLLFTPGPLTVSAETKQAMLVDYGSRDSLFLKAAEDVKTSLLSIAGASKETGHECVILQGSGTFGVEAMLGCAVPRTGGKVLIVTNGSYGLRQEAICRYMGIENECLNFPHSDALTVEAIMDSLRKSGGAITHLSIVHHETTAGVLNPLEDIVKAVKAEFPQVEILVDSMSGFGAYDMQMHWGIDWAVSSANKCIEGVPGFSYVLVRRDVLEKSKPNARSLSLDVYDQWQHMEATGQFRYTPPTHAVLAFKQALAEWEAEGGVAGRFARYEANYKVLKRQMDSMGFEFFVPEAHRSVCIATIKQPDHPNFVFETFYDLLAEQGFVIYPGKIAGGSSFRIGIIGRLFPKDVEMLGAAIKVACEKMNVPLPLK